MCDSHRKPLIDFNQLRMITIKCIIVLVIITCYCFNLCYYVSYYYCYTIYYYIVVGFIIIIIIDINIVVYSNNDGTGMLIHDSHDSGRGCLSLAVCSAIV